MGTRSLTVFQDAHENEIVVMYRQMDGYPSGHGEDLADFLKDIVMVNGFKMGVDYKQANGMECLAAQVVAHFKEDVGGFYLHPAGTRDIGEEYVYTIYPGEDAKINMRCQGWKNEIIYDGPADEFDKRKDEE